MKKVIKGKMYDTETAKEVGHDYNTCNTGDFTWWDERLYQKRTGEFFLHGQGGPMSRYATSSGTNSWGYGSVIIPLSPDEALEWAEKHMSGEEVVEYFGEPVEDESKQRVSIVLSAAVVSKMKILANKRGITLSAAINEALEQVEGE